MDKIANLGLSKVVGGALVSTSIFYFTAASHVFSYCSCKSPVSYYINILY